MNFITKLEVQQWVQSLLQLIQLYEWDILKSNYSGSTFKYGEHLAEYIKENWNHFLDDCYTV